MVVGFGIVGSGHMGGIYAQTLSDGVPGARLVGVAGGSRAEELAKRQGVAHLPSIEELFGQPDVDAVVIATPTRRTLGRPWPRLPPTNMSSWRSRWRSVLPCAAA